MSLLWLQHFKIMLRWCGLWVFPAPVDTPSGHINHCLSTQCPNKSLTTPAIPCSGSSWGVIGSLTAHQLERWRAEEEAASPGSSGSPVPQLDRTGYAGRISHRRWHPRPRHPPCCSQSPHHTLELQWSPLSRQTHHENMSLLKKSNITVNGYNFYNSISSCLKQNVLLGVANYLYLTQLLIAPKDNPFKKCLCLCYF